MSGRRVQDQAQERHQGPGQGQGQAQGLPGAQVLHPEPARHLGLPVPPDVLDLKVP